MTDSGPPSRRFRSRLAACVTAGALVVAACSSGGGTVDEAAPASDPSTDTVTTPAATTDPATSETTSPATTAPPPTTPPEPPAPTVDAFAAIDPIVAAHVAERSLNGAGLVIVDRDAGIVHEQYWGEFGPDRVSLVASSSKMIAAGVLLALDDRGDLDLDAPVANVVGWADDHPTITPAQLVSNSSGLPGLVEGFAVPPYLCQYLPLGELQGCAETILTTDVDDQRVVAPDTEFRYGGAQWQVAGAVAEVASGRSWNDLVDETYEACDVGSLEFTNQWTQFGSIDFSYPDRFDADPSTLSPTENPNIEGGAYLSARDYASLLLMVLREGRCGDEQVLSPEAVERMLADRIGDVYGGSDGANTNRGYGMGWFVERDTGRRLDPGAYGSVPWIDPDAGYGAYLIVEATGDDGDDLAAELFDVVETAVLRYRNTLDE